MNNSTYAEFLELPENRRYEALAGKLHLWQRIEFYFVNKWWTSIREENLHMRAYDLWESIYKGRF